MDKLPLISVIIPTYNEADYISDCLSAIQKQDYSADQIEVLIIDGLSTDNTRLIISEFTTTFPQINVRIFENNAKIVPVAMNMAMQLAKGDILIRVDGHCVIASDYVRRCVEHLQTQEVDAVGGSMKSIGRGYISGAIAVSMSSVFGVGNSAFRTMAESTMFVDTVPFPAYPRKVIERAGFYDEELVRNQDDEYNYRIRELGGKILLADNVHSMYFSRSSLTGLWRQYFQYGYWKVRVFQKHPRQMSLRQFVPPTFVLSLIGSTFLILFPASWPFALVIPFLYLFTNLLASTYIALTRDWRSLPVLPIIFIILHISYGSGFLFGLIKFINRWGDKTGKTPTLDSR